MNPRLMTTAATIGRLTGKTPTETQIAFEAMHTASVTRPGRMMYRGLKSDDDVSIGDARQLLENRGISTIVSQYPMDGSVKALGDLTVALGDANKAVLVCLGGETTGGVAREVAVIGVDTTTKTVVIDDAGRSLSPDRRSAVSLDNFSDAWRAGGFEMVIAELVDPVEAPPAAWARLRPRREMQDADQRRSRRRR